LLKNGMSDKGMNFKNTKPNNSMLVYTSYLLHKLEHSVGTLRLLTGLYKV